VTASTNITIAKSPASGPVLTGDLFFYTVTMNATGANAVFTPAQVSVRDILPAGITNVGQIAPAADYGATCTVVVGPPEVIECTGGTITVGVPASLFIPIVVTGCGPMANVATADPNNAIPETNEADNASVPVIHTNTCDVTMTKLVNPADGVIETHAGTAAGQYGLFLSDIAAGQTQVAISSVSDTLPAGFVVVGTPTVLGGTGTCTVTGTPPAAQTVTCTNVTGVNGLFVLIDFQVPTTVARGNYDNTATVTTPGDVDLTNNSSTITVTVFPFDIVVENVPTIDPVITGNQWGYQITVRNNSAGGVASGPFFLNGGLALRNSTAQGDGAGSAAAFATLQSVNSVNVGVTCTLPGGGNGLDQRYSCLINNIPAGGNVVISALALALAAEADGAPEVSLDANATNSGIIPVCTGGGLEGGCAPEAIGFVPANVPAEATAFLANNRVAVLTDVD
jgi:hypothetical protein